MTPVRLEAEKLLKYYTNQIFIGTDIGHTRQKIPDRNDDQQMLLVWGFFCGFFLQIKT